MLTHPAGTSRKGRLRWSLLAFRTLAALVAVLLIFAIEAWRKILIPWIAYGEIDTIGYGWDRHAELFLVPDTAAALMQFSFGVAAMILAVRPLGRSAVVSWLSAGILMVAWVGMFTAHFAGSSLVEAALQGIVLTVALCVPLVLLHPQRRAVIRGGLPAAGAVPGRLLRFDVAVIGLAGAGLAIGSILWRAGGGIFENALEDSVLSLVLFGLALALGALLCWLGREGWKTLACILNGMVAFAVIALVSIAVS